MNYAFQGHITSPLEFTLKLAKDLTFEGCKLLWFNPSQHLSCTQPLPHSPDGMGGGIRRVKARKLTGWDKDSLVGKARATLKTKEFSHTLPAVSSLEKLFGLDQEHCPSCKQLLRRVYFPSYIQTHHPVILVWSPSTAQTTKFHPVGTCFETTDLKGYTKTFFREYSNLSKRYFPSIKLFEKYIVAPFLSFPLPQ